MPTPASHARTFGKHVALSACAAWCLGAADAALAAPHQVGTLATYVWVGGSCLALWSLPWGLAQATLAVLGERFAGTHAARAWARLSSPIQRDPELTHAAVIAALTLLTVVTLGTSRAHGVLASIQDPKLQRLLLAAAAGVLVAVGLAFAGLTFPLVRRLVRAFAERFGLPWPRSQLVRFALFVGAPSALLLGGLLRRYGDDLGFLLRPIGLLLFIELQLLVYLIWRAVTGYPRRALGALAALLLLASAAAPPLMPNKPAARAASAKGIYTPMAVAALTRLSDRDRDGFSHFFAGGDCGPADAKVNRAALDVPGDGRDEDCSGSDAKPAAGSSVPVYARGSRLKKQHYNVLWIVVDALRPDSMSVYGYARPNTPALNQLASESLLFERAYAGSTTTHLSFGSFLSGLNAEAATWEYGTDRARLEVAPHQRTLAERLGDAGYRTTAIVSPFIAHLPALLRGFQVVHSEHRGAFDGDGPGAAAATIDAVHEAGARPAFVLTYFDGPHRPYSAHPPPFPSYGGDDKALYDAEIAYVDHYIGAIVEHLRLHPTIWNNTIVVVSSDHGEEFSEHGRTAHGRTCYEESARVPLLLHVPGQPARRIDVRVGLVDVVPTLLELLALPEPTRSQLSGRSLLSTLDEGAGDVPTFCAIMNQGNTLTGRPFFERAVRFGSRSLVEKLTTGERELYDSALDPREQKPLPQSPENARQIEYLSQLLQQNATGNLFKKRLTN